MKITRFGARATTSQRLQAPLHGAAWAPAQQQQLLGAQVFGPEGADASEAAGQEDAPGRGPWVPGRGPWLVTPFFWAIDGKKKDGDGDFYRKRLEDVLLI